MQAVVVSHTKSRGIVEPSIRGVPIALLSCLPKWSIRGGEL